MSLCTYIIRMYVLMYFCSLSRNIIAPQLRLTHPIGFLFLFFPRDPAEKNRKMQM